MRQGLASWYFLVLAALPSFAAPPDALGIALAHARTLPKDYDRQTRYLDLTHKVGIERAECVQALSYLLNSFSKYKKIKQPEELPGGVLHFDLRWYGIDPKVYLKLGTVDVYYHRKVTGDTGKYGYYPPAPELQPQIQELYDLTYSQIPILKGDWLLHQVAVQKDRVVGYYDLLGVGKSEADFQRLVGVNVKESQRLYMEDAAVVTESGVTLNNRGISRFQSITGGYWRTQDYKKTTDLQNRARLLAGEAKPDATEQYGVLPNGLFAFFLANDKGERQDTAPDFIAGDSRSPSPDKRVHVGLSCIRCHVEGLRNIDDFARKLFRQPVFLRSFDYNTLKNLEQVYLTDLTGQLAKDNAYFAEKVKECNGLTVAENARVFASVYEQHEASVDASHAAAELGCDERALLARVREYAATNAVIDPVIAAYAQTPPLTIRREHFEETYHVFQQILGRVK